MAALTRAENLIGSFNDPLEALEALIAEVKPLITVHSQLLEIRRDPEVTLERMMDLAGKQVDQVQRICEIGIVVAAYAQQERALLKLDERERI